MAGKSLPRAGHVSQLRQNWSVFEDEALANKIQHEEINHHYQGNKNRNQQIRADIPQVKELQTQEVEVANNEMTKYRQRLDAQAELDEKLALQLALGQSRFGQPMPPLSNGPPLYTHHEPSALQQSHEAAAYQSINSSSTMANTARFAQFDEPPAMQIAASSAFPAAFGEDDEYTRKRDEVFARNIQDLENKYRLRQKMTPQTSEAHTGQASANSGAYRLRVAQPAAVIPDEPLYANNNIEEQLLLRSGQQQKQHTVHLSPPLMTMQQPVSSAVNHRKLERRSDERMSVSYNTGAASSSGNYNIDLNTSSDYFPSSKTSERSDSSLTSYSELGACGGAPPSYSLEPHSANGGAYSLEPQTKEGAYSLEAQSSGVIYSPEATVADDVLGLRSAFSPAEIRAAEEAEILFEQERKDAALALQLQEQLQLSEEEDATQRDRRLALEAQDREYARSLQAKEKARARRAKEKARQRKLDRQQQHAEADEDAAVDQHLLHGLEDESPRAGPEAVAGGRLSRVSGGESAAPSRLSGRGELVSPREREGMTSTSPRDAQDSRESRLSPRSPDPNPPARRPYVHTDAIDTHTNDTYCKTQITPTQSNSGSESTSSEPQYANLDDRGQPLKTEPILHLPTSKNNDKISPRQCLMNEDMPVPPYMPMQSSASRKSESMERKIKKKKEKEGCKQQ